MGIIGLADAARAQEAESESPTVVLAPSSPVLLREPDKAPPTKAIQAFREGFHDRLGDESKIRSIPDDKLAQSARKLPLFKDTLKIAQEWATIGIESYKRLKTKRAVTNLERALHNYRDIHYDVVKSKRIAEISRYLALSYLERNAAPERATQLFQQMLALDSTQRVREGYYPKPVVSSFRSAREAYIRKIQLKDPPAERAKRLLNLRNADFVVFLAVVPRSKTTYRAIARVYESGEGYREARQIDFKEITDRQLRRAGNRLASGLVPCLMRPVLPRTTREKPVARDRSSRFGFEANVAYASFLLDPEMFEKPFGHFGLSLGGQYRVDANLDITSRVQVLNATSDYTGRLIDSNFNTLRGFAGVAPGFSIGAFNLGGSVSVEATRIEAFRACGNLDAIPTGCRARRDQRHFDDFELLIGANVRPRILYSLGDHFELRASADASYYFYPLREVRMNFPVATELGFAYQF